MFDQKPKKHLYQRTQAHHANDRYGGHGPLHYVTWCGMKLPVALYVKETSGNAIYFQGHGLFKDNLAICVACKLAASRHPEATPQG